MNEDKLLRLIEEAGIQEWDEESDEEVCNIVVFSTSTVRSRNENIIELLDADGKDVAIPVDSNPVGFNGGFGDLMPVGLHGQNIVSGTSTEDIEMNAVGDDVAFVGEDDPSTLNAELENNHLLNFTTGFFEDGDGNSNNNSSVNNNSHFLINPETGLLENILEGGLSETSHRSQLINPATGLLEDVAECSEPNVNAEAKRGKKIKRNPATWKRNKIRINNDHIVMRALPLCRCKCKDKLNQSECKEIFNKFINFSNHTEQNIYLQGCLFEDVPNRFRSRKKSERRSRSRRVFKYNVKTENRTVTVCQQTFLAIHGIERDRLRRKVMHKEKDIQDGRGKHNKHPVCDQDTMEKVNRFLFNLPARESHYSRSSNKHKKYLDANLSVAELHRKFLKDNPENLIKYDKFREIFNFDFNYAFGQPRKDICHTCEKFKVKIDAARACNNQGEKETLERDQKLHLRKAQVFLEKLSIAEKDRTKMRLCFDYQKNLPLPVTNVGDEYYLRQLWMHNFGVHNLEENTATMYVYTENYALKGPNEVLTALQDYIQINKKTHQTHLELFCDNNCYSQNKNRYLFAFLDQMCAKGIFETAKIFYPIPGHSMMPIDRDFALIERKRIKADKVFTPDFYINIILNSNNTNKFQIVCLQNNLSSEGLVDRVVTVKDFKGFYDGRIKTTIPGISTCRQVQFHKIGKPEMSQSMTSQSFSQFALYRKGMTRIIQRVLVDCYRGQIKLKEAKIRDIRKLLDYIPLEARQFYDIIIKYNEEHYGEHAAEDVENEEEEL